MDKKFLIVMSVIFLLVIEAGCRESAAQTPTGQVTSQSVKGEKKSATSSPHSGKSFISGAKDVPASAKALRSVPPLGEKIVRSDEEWKKLLSPEQYRVLRQSGTERAWTGALNTVKDKDGIFHCAACNAPLFKADTKFESGSGWPSFYDAIKGRVVLKEDNSLGMSRVEVLCAACGGHLGHVFHDGPKPTGLRYCINSAAMNYEAAEPKKAAK